MSKLYDLILSIQTNDKDSITELMCELQHEIELDQSIYNSESTHTLDYLYQM